MADWTTENAAELYGIGYWGEGYFSIEDGGDVVVHPEGSGGPGVNLRELVEEIRHRGLHTPLLIRFSDILASRIDHLVECFGAARREYSYAGQYRPVYPIKTNQQRQVVEELIDAGRRHNLGLEVGSKPELLIAMALLDTPDALIVCNGFKDRAYMETALLAQRLGRFPVIVLDRPDELPLLLKVSHELGISPHIGVRCRLATRGAGKWADSTGDRSKFGLTAAEIVEVVKLLRSEEMLGCLEMLHFHIGSQITEIRAHKEALREASRIYVGLHDLGCKLRFVDVGGGLGVDYVGSKTSLESSMNYTVQEYAFDVVAALQEACDERGVPHPDLVSESGRALVSHASVLIFDVLGVDGPIGRAAPQEPGASEHKVIRDLWEVWSAIESENAQESFHDALELKEESTTAFNLGYLDLAARARAEELFWSCCERILNLLPDLEHVPEELQGLEQQLSDTYYGNFSVFQSLPDSWALDQIFPIMPIQRLHQEPTRRGTFADLTCDCDGKIDRFINMRGDSRVLPLHEPDGRPYYVGAFLVGAYQETLGELHNLFGDTDAVHVRVDATRRYSIEQVVEGDSVEEVLSYVQYDRRDLSERVRRAIETALYKGNITLEESALLRRRYEQGLSGYTYLD
ncbi:MAG: biosynthetic arginine decarboxylase [Myxococcota bacterium]